MQDEDASTVTLEGKQLRVLSTQSCPIQQKRQTSSDSQGIIKQQQMGD